MTTRYLEERCYLCGGLIRAEDGDEFVDEPQGLRHAFACFPPVDLVGDTACLIGFRVLTPDTPLVLDSVDRVFYFLAGQGLPWWADR